MYLPIKWGVKEPPANPQNHRVVNMSTLKSSRALIGKGSSSSPRFLIPWIYPPQSPGWLGMAPQSDKFSLATSQHPGGWLDPNSIPAPRIIKSQVFCFLTGRSKKSNPKEPEPTPKNPSQTIKTPPEFAGSIVDYHPFFGWFSPGGNWGFSFGVGLTPG